MRNDKLAFVVLLTLVVLFLATSRALSGDLPLVAAHQSAAAPHTRSTVFEGTSVVIVISDASIAEADEVKQALLDAGIADVVDCLDARYSTPTLADIENYGCVITWSRSAYADATTWGDVLADYVDVGGAVVVTQLALFTSSAIGGRFMSELSPLTAGYNGYQTHNLGWYDPTHPIMEGVTSCSSYYNYEIQHRGNVEDVAHYDNDWPLVAVNADHPNVVGINAAFGQSYRRWTGDMMTILLNSVVYARQSAPAAFMTCETVSNAFCRGKKFFFKLMFRNNTDDELSGVLSFRAYAGRDCDPVNTLVTIPRSKTYVPGPTMECYSFKVPNAAPLGEYSASVSGTFGGIDLFCCMNTEIVRCEPWRVGDNTDWQLVEEDRLELPLPTVTELHHNHPNPFNVSTVIGYELPTDTYVRLEIYNLFGQKVATVVDGQQEAGYRWVTWENSELASGVYFYKLTAGDFTEVKRMSLLK
jgi:hypothetical protein